MKSRIELFYGYISNLSAKMDRFNQLIGVKSLCEDSFFLPTLGNDQIEKIDSFKWHDKLNKIFYAGINWDFASKLRKSNLAGESPKKLPKLNKKGYILEKKITDFDNNLSLEEKINILDTDSESKGELNDSRTRVLNFLDSNIVDIY